jgi:hypothetical protein
MLEHNVDKILYINDKRHVLIVCAVCSVTFLINQ